MTRYETLFLAVPEITADEAKNIESQLEKAVQQAKGTVLSYERWGKYKLAYPVRNYDYGVYFLMRFEVADAHKAEVLDAIRTFFTVKQSEIIMRFVLGRLHGQSLEYQRGESLEEAPSHSVDSFLKENKMTGLLHKQQTSSAAEHDDTEEFQA